MVSDVLPASDFIGRREELATLTGALGDAISGHGRIVMLAGEPGIGKTRIAHELVAQAEAKGAKVLWGWCYERQGAPPYWPWIQAIRSYTGKTDPDLLRQELGPGYLKSPVSSPSWPENPSNRRHLPLPTRNKPAADSSSPYQTSSPTSARLDRW